MPGNLAAALEATAKRAPDKAVLIHGDGVLCWRELDARAGAVATDLARRGIEAGDRVALEFEDPVRLTIALLGALKAGAAVTPLNPRLAEDEKSTILAALDAKLVLRQLGSEEAAFEARPVDDTNPAFILFTSGSTGVPKGVVLSHRASHTALEHWRGPILDLSSADVVLSTLPPAHSLGIFGTILAPLLAGATVVFLSRFSPEDALAAIEEHGVTVYPGVATMFQLIVDSPALRKTGLSSLRFAASGAAPCSWELAEQWRRATGTRIIRGYGMTELFRPISYSALDERDMPDAIGRAVADVRLRIVDGEGNDLASGEVGELWINSPAHMTGYLDEAEQTEAVLAAEWFKTGDLASIDGEGFVRIEGRLKDIILRGGYTIAAGSIEQVLLSHPGIAEAAVIGVPHRELGEEIAAYVVLRPGAEATAETIVDYCKQHLANFKYPRQVHLLDELPKGPTGKILKVKLQS
ncbi:MAG: AMP-binding protein [Alphaproteobacteria bacterium]|jgi:long-chain acyl-CoA synthetase|nr:AMP-binding protein [Alphaproteobacteria bacterium]